MTIVTEGRDRNRLQGLGRPIACALPLLVGMEGLPLFGIGKEAQI